MLICVCESFLLKTAAAIATQKGYLTNTQEFLTEKQPKNSKNLTIMLISNILSGAFLKAIKTILQPRGYISLKLKKNLPTEKQL